MTAEVGDDILYLMIQIDRAESEGASRTIGQEDSNSIKFAGEINMNYVLQQLSNNDNEIKDVYKDGTEYIIKIEVWNGNICYLKTLRCKSILYKDDLVGNLGDIIFDNGSYKFMTLDNEEVILEIIADEIFEADR